MKIKELLEYKIHNIEDNRARTSVKVFENPNKMQFMNLLYDKRNHDNVVRGLVIDNDTYVWIAYDATHFSVKQYLIRQGMNDPHAEEIFDGEFVLFIFEIDDNDPDVDMKMWIYNNSADNHDRVYLNPAFKRMTRNLKIGKWT